VASGGTPNGKKDGDEAAIVALASGYGVAAAARVSALSRRTIYRRLQDRDFRDRIAQIRNELLERAAGKLANQASKAARVLVKLLECPDPKVRLQAASKILGLGPLLREHGELAEQLAELQQLVKGQGHVNGGDAAAGGEGPSDPGPAPDAILPER
jgi:hypothetical protein